MKTLPRLRNLILTIPCAWLLLTGGRPDHCSARSLTLEFDQPAGTVLDRYGNPTGFTSRLPGTSEPPLDTALILNPLFGHLQLSTKVGDPNGGAGVGNLSMPGIRLSTLGYTGTEDFSVYAKYAIDPVLSIPVFPAIPPLDPIDQVGIYVGNDVGNFTRAGVIQFDQPEYLAVHTTNSFDNNGKFFGAGIDISDGMEVTVQRIGGDWQYFIDGVEWQPNSINTGTGFPVDPNGVNGSPNLDASTDLYVGVFALTVFNSNTKLIYLDRFAVTVVPEPMSAVLATALVLGIIPRCRERRAPVQLRTGERPVPGTGT